MGTTPEAEEGLDKGSPPPSGTEDLAMEERAPEALVETKTYDRILQHLQHLGLVLAVVQDSTVKTSLYEREQRAPQEL